jgi:osmotically-inducible protein OsmY
MVLKKINSYRSKVMQKNSKLWQTALAVSATSVLIVLTPEHGRSETTGLSGTKSPHTSGRAAVESAKEVSKAMGDEATTEADRTLNQRIRQALKEDSSLAAAAQNVYLKTDKGEVMLHGSVATKKEKADVGAKVRQVMGVKKVQNQLQITPPDIRAGITSDSTSPSASSNKGSSSSTASH